MREHAKHMKRTLTFSTLPSTLKSEQDEPTDVHHRPRLDILTPAPIYYPVDEPRGDHYMPKLQAPYHLYPCLLEAENAFLKSWLRHSSIRPTKR